MKKNRENLEFNEEPVTLLMFLGLYNQNIPMGFPHASAASLKIFHDTHPMLFRRSGKWSIARHRKKLMDWLASHPDLS